MRDFRGKRLDTGEWIFGDCVHSVYKIGDTCVGQYGDTLGMHQVTPKTVGQYSGIFTMDEQPDGDTLVTAIYEGDIVEAVLTDGIHTDFSWGRHVVVFDRGAFCLKDRRGLITPMCNYSVNVKFKVLGNVFDNPELWEVSE